MDWALNILLINNLTFSKLWGFGVLGFWGFGGRGSAGRGSAGRGSAGREEAPGQRGWMRAGVSEGEEEGGREREGGQQGGCSFERQVLYPRLQVLLSSSVLVDLRDRKWHRRHFCN